MQVSARPVSQPVTIPTRGECPEKNYKEQGIRPGIVVHTVATWEAEAGGSRIQWTTRAALFELTLQWEYEVEQRFCNYKTGLKFCFAAYYNLIFSTVNEKKIPISWGL